MAAYQFWSITSGADIVTREYVMSWPLPANSPHYPPTTHSSHSQPIPSNPSPWQNTPNFHANPLFISSLICSNFVLKHGSHMVQGVKTLNKRWRLI